VLLFRDAGGTIIVYRPRVLRKISGGKGFILIRVISFRYGEMVMFRFGVWVIVSAVLTPNVWGQASTQGSPTPAAPSSTTAPADAGKKSTAGKHHHKHHHHHKKQAPSTQ
jgi:hypothetical protein